MKRFYTSLLGLLMTISLAAADVQGWPANYGGVMLQGFYWDSFTDTQWANLESQADELASYFNLIWIPQSGKCLETYNTMGYTPYYYFNQNSSFGTEAQLRSMINTFKAKGLGTIADVVVNHHNTNGWWSFPAETYKGVTYQFKTTDIVANDDGGGAATQAKKDGITLSSNNDEGEGWGGMRDLDHKSSNVQTIVMAYVKYLVDDLGYTGFRYDMVKGFSGTHVADYNNHAGVEYSVGECWDGTTTIRNWIDATKVNGWPTSAAFDFQFRYVVRNAANGTSWLKLGQQNDNNWPLMSDDYDNGNYRRWAITFVENHDTERRSNAEQDPLKKDTLAANAYMLAMPGTPCVFLKHWQDCKQDIKSMIDVRKVAGIHSQSVYAKVASNKFYYAVKTGNSTSDYRLLAVVGSNANSYTLPTTEANNFVKVLSGYHYAYYLNKSLGTAWIDLASGTYEGDTEATITAVSTNSNARLVYTTDGSTPTATSQQATSGTKISLPKGTTTLTVGLLIGSTVSGIVSRTYTVTAFEPYDINVYVNTSNVGWTSINYWTWGGDGSHTPTNSSWPGDKVTTTKTINGKTWYYKTFRINSSTDNVSFVFSTGTGSPQTVDITNINKESFFEIATTQTDGKYNVNNVTDVYSGIGNITIDETKPHTTNNAIYNLAGQRVDKTYKGIVIKNGKKVVIK